MKNTVKLVVDLSHIKEDPELEKELYREERPIKVAAVRNGKILTSEEINTKEIEDFSKIPITLEFDYPSENPPGVYIIVAPNLPEREFLGIDAKKIWAPPKIFKKFVADLRKEKIEISVSIFKRWLWLCRTFTITGKVVKRVLGDGGYCDEPVPGATVEAFDVDCWWFWWHRDLVDTTTTNPDGTFEMTFRWCCLLRLPIFRRRWVIDPDILKHLTKAFKPHIGPIPPEVIKSPIEFEKYLERVVNIPGPIPPKPYNMKGEREFSFEKKEIKEINLMVEKSVSENPANMRERLMSPIALESPLKPLIEKLRPQLSFIPCWPFRWRDCTPDIVFKVTQECEEDVKIIYEDGPFQTRWNIPTNLNVTLMANEEACSITNPLCEEPPVGDCLKFTKINCYDVDTIGSTVPAIGAPDLRGYLKPGLEDHPFAGTIRTRGRFGAGSDVDYFKVQYSYDDGAFKDIPKEDLVGFGRKYWAPVTPATPAKWNYVAFVPNEVDGEVVYKTLKKAEEENPLLPGWTWGYLWNDLDTLFRWNSKDIEGDGLYILKLVGYRWNETTQKLENEHTMLTCDIQTSQDEIAMVRIDNRNANNPIYDMNEDRPCGPGTIHLCTYEPDCDFQELYHIRKDTYGNILDTTLIGPCDIIDLSDNDDIEIHFHASDADGHLQGYHMYAHWGENLIKNLLTTGTLEKDPNELVGPNYAQTLTGVQGTYRSTLLSTNPEHDRPYWYGGDFKVTISGDEFEKCAYTLKLRTWKRTIENCQNSYYVHANWCSYSFTINKI